MRRPRNQAAQIWRDYWDDVADEGWTVSNVRILDGKSRATMSYEAEPSVTDHLKFRDLLPGVRLWANRVITPTHAGLAPIVSRTNPQRFTVRVSIGRSSSLSTSSQVKPIVSIPTTMRADWKYCSAL
jgi:hypothetical protein